MSGRAVRKLLLPRLLAIHVLIVWHVMLENGVSGGIFRHARGGIDSHLAVKHAEVLAPGDSMSSVEVEVLVVASECVPSPWRSHHPKLS